VNVLVTVIACILLVGFAGLMTATEAALSVLSVTDIRQMAHQRRAKRSLQAIAGDLRAHRNITNFARISAEMVVAVLVTVALVTSTLYLWIDLVIAVVIMVAVSFVLAGSSPRSVGRAHPQGVLSSSAVLVHILRVVLGPIANLLVALGDRVTPGRPGSGVFTSEEQLLSMVDEAVRHDVLEDDERELIHSIFEWNDTVVREVMIPRVDMVTIDGDADLQTAAELFVASGFSRLPVIGEDTDEVLGVLYLRDVARRSMLGQQDLDQIFARDLMRSALFIPEFKKADETLKEMQSLSTHVALIVDEYGGIAGLVTLEDLIEELVGEISDEHDRTVPDVLELARGAYSVTSRLNIEDLGELFGIELDDDDVDSVGGLVTKQLGRLPQVGDRVQVSGLDIEASEVDASRGHLTRVTVSADEDLLAARQAFVTDERTDD